MHALSPEEFRSSLLYWWEHNQRSYPWRNTRDPFRILIAEALLHRTRADQVVQIYERFIQRYPDVQAVAQTTPDELHEIVYSAGLRWRVDLLLETAREIDQRFSGEVPVDREALESLPGIGPYIAAAIRCFAHGLPDAILDTNTVRIASRVFGFVLTDGSRRSKKVLHLLEFLLDAERPRAFNLALLDLGALICRPQRPLCRECPVQPQCAYGRHL